jgi:protein-disulfide isomerase
METRELLEELTGISDKLHLIVKDFVRDEQEAQNLGITHIPTFVLQGHTKGAVRDFGIPAGTSSPPWSKTSLTSPKGRRI